VVVGISVNGAGEGGEVHVREIPRASHIAIVFVYPSRISW